MGVRITDRSHVGLYCSTDGTAFGPVMADESEAEDFLAWIAENDWRDPRDIPPVELLSMFAAFQKWLSEPLEPL